MKQIYVRPEIELIQAELISMVCASNPRVVVKPNAYWGEKVDQNQYANNDWINEGYSGVDVDFSQGTVIPVAGDDQWDLPSRGNTGLWEN